MTTVTFADLGIAEPLCRTLADQNYIHPTPIQAQSIPALLEGRDLLGLAQTGTGKTAAFALPILQKLTADRAKAGPKEARAVILAPTRELAMQISKSFETYGKGSRLRQAVVFGGVNQFRQVRAMSGGVDILVATPGRLLDLMNQKHVNLGRTSILVLDEADRMLDMGFFDDIVTVAKQCPKTRQTLLFSATYPEGIAKLSAQFMREPVTVKVEAQHAGAQIEQRWYEVKDTERLDAVSKLLAHFRPASTLAFCNTKAQCRDLVAVLQAQGISSLALFGELEQRERDQVLVRFANRSCSVLVATDVAARGLDITSLAAVINVDVTPDAEVHIHRIGRTGRAGESGLALNLVSMDEMGSVGKIEQLQGRESKWHPVSELVPTGKGPLVPPMVTLHIQGGRKEKIRPGDVLGALTADLGYTREQVGKINVNEWSTYVAVDRNIAEQVASRLNDGRIKGKSVKVRVLED
ncbi:MAG: ATP-dependent RNA helicase DbpA [Parvibaculum sp.]|uniref:ATP-dependent RNA helicase DbpA n=1 Tax=Parvibaculum sp. TaxID=2024848 RepID=UPI002ABA6657|nr:ATP-dependent RNA helicase DbpA [Parvibaculum sp.]MDZ4382413.1 ATP-dependent RNA helicase DbpA [Parvibaculum sp.]